jgi:amino acid adenylation domain-containing protein
LTVEELLASLRDRDVRLEVRGDRLRISAPRGALDAVLREALTRHKSEILSRLGADDGSLSFGQERLWFLDQLEPQSAAYNIPLVLEIDGRLNPEALASALSEVVRRHEVLRTACRVEDGRPVAILHPPEPVPLPAVDLAALPDDERRARLDQLVAEEARVPFDLGHSPFLRARLYRTGAEAHVISIVTHHFVADGWSMRVLVQELGILYEAFARGEPSPLAPLQVQYSDAARAQRSKLTGAHLESEVAWWRERLTDRPPPLDLPIAGERPALRTGRGGRLEFTVPPQISEALRGLARRQGATLFMVLLAGLQALLSRYTGLRDLIVATAVSNRPRADLENLIGCFANTLLIRTDLSGDPTFAELLARVRATAIDAYAHQELPFERLVEALQPERDLARTPLFQVMLVLENAPSPTVRLANLRLRALDPDPGTARFDLMVNVVDGGRGLTGFVEYDAGLFERASIDRLVGHWRALLAAAADAPGLRLSELPLLTPEEEAKHAAWSETVIPRTPFRPLHAAIQEQAARTPAATAIEWEGGALTYAELMARAGRLASYLRGRGVAPDQPVGVFLDRGPDLVVSLVAILAAGGAYVPLEPDHPDERIAYVLDDSGAGLVLTCETLAARLPSRAGIEPVLLDRDAADLRKESEALPELRLHEENLAYIIYTSGSTGRPKGAMNTHAAIVNRLEWTQEAFRLAPEDRVAQKTPCGFDVSVWELFWPLRVGARLVLARPGGHRDPFYLARWIEERGISVIHFVPSMLQTFLDTPGLERCGTLRLIVASGEALKRPLVQRCHERLRAELHNLYGPTEAAVDVSHGPCERGEEGPVSIGRPIANTGLFVLDESLRPVPVGVPGELCIGGISLARGYRKAPGRTAERFVPDPRPASPGARLYRTGDRARLREDGALEFLGRLDHQVKLRGVRIELGEVEAALSEHPSVREAAVALDESGAEPRLIGYVVPAGGRPAPSDLRRYLLAKLPEAMVPGAFVELRSLPVGPSGKLDRRALPQPTPIEPRRSAVYAPPRTPAEERLAAIWCDLLDLERVATFDSFFDLGGHSLLAARLIARIRDRLGVELPLRAVFAGPTLAAMARSIEAAVAGSEPAIPAIPRGEALPLSFFQERLWFLDQFEPGTATLNMPIAVRLRGTLDADSLARALELLLQRHEALRVRFRNVEGWPVQEAIPDAALPLAREDLSEFPEDEREATLAERAAAEAARPFDLSEGPLARARLLRLQDADHVLLLTVHHIAADGWSLAVLLDELSRAYDAFSRGQEPPLEPARLQYADFARWQRDRLRGDALDGSLAYWRHALDGAPPHLELPTDFARPPIQSYCGGRASCCLPPVLAGRLRRLASRHGATTFMFLLAALDVVLYRWSGQNDIVVGAPVAGRPRLELEAVVGPFLNTLPLRASLASNPTFVQLLGHVRDVAVEAYAHQDAPLEKVLESTASTRDLARTPVFQVMLNLLNFPTEAIRLPDLTLEVISLPDPPSKFDLTVYVSDEEGGLRLELVYNADLFAADRMRDLLRQFERVLEQAVERPDDRIMNFDLRTPEARDALPDPTQELNRSFPGSVHERFGAIARKHPRRIALDVRSGAWSYGELETSANRLARHLGALGVRRGDVVAIYARRGAELVWAVLASLKAGGVFSILDPSYPARRLTDFLRVARSRVFVRLEEAGPLPPLVEEHLAGVRDCVRLDLPVRPSASDAWESLSSEPPTVAIGPDDGACLTFTSGSTGEPKGVLGLHRSLSHFLDWQRDAWRLSEGDRFSMLSGLAHDPLQRDLFTPLQLGAALCIPDAATMGNPGDLVEWAAREGVTVMHLTPAMLQLLVEGGADGARRLGSLRLALVVGDVLTRRDVERFRDLAPTCTCVNLYGSTETQRAVGYHVVSPRLPELPAPGEAQAVPREVLPLGRGIPDVQLLVVNAAGRLAGVGELGEVWVRSPHLARGYLGDEVLTRDRFLANPFASSQEFDRVYRTGDLGRYRHDGVVEGAGRADRQVKVRGFRIEPAEIEAALERHPEVRECAVVVRDDAPGGRGLVAYIAPRGTLSPTSEALRRHLADHLPEPMIPSAFVEVPRLPLTATGKLDRENLPAPSARSASGGFQLPRDTLELGMARIWEEILDRRPVGVRDDFFAIGGHSLLAVRLLAKVEATWGARLPLAALFQGPTVEQMASLLRGPSRRRPRCPLIPIQPRGDEPALFCVHPVGGTVLCYSGLSKHLGMEQPFFGLEALGVEGDRDPLTTVEAMASAYLNAVRKERPRGPYRLAGWSFGGLVAFEMARRLRREGEETALALIDVWPPGSLGPLEEATDEVTILRLLARALGDLSGESFDVESDRLRNVGDREAQLALVVAEAHRAGALPPDVGVERLRPLFAVISANIAARRGFQPERLPGSLLLVRARESIDTVPASPTLGWERIVEEVVDVREAPGDHYTIMAEPHVRDVARWIVLSYSSPTVAVKQ